MQRAPGERCGNTGLRALDLKPREFGENGDPRAPHWCVKGSEVSGGKPSVNRALRFWLAYRCGFLPRTVGDIPITDRAALSELVRWKSLDENDLAL